MAAGLRVLPLYAMLYTFSQLVVQWKYNLPGTWETIKSISRSTFFIFFHAYNGSVMGCALRRISGRFYYRILVCAPALISSYLSLLIEKPARRQALAFYMLNLASEIIYRMAVTKGYFKPIRNGETLLFALSLAAWYHLIKTQGFSYDPVSAAVKVLIGRSEAKSRSKKRVSELEDKPSCERTRLDKLNPSQIISDRHPSCTHGEPTCFRYILEPIPSRFLIGYGIQTILKLSSRPFELIAKPKSTIMNALSSRASIRFGLFIVCLVSSGRLASCSLRRYSEANCDWHGAASGFLAGLSMLWAPRSSLSMYVMWKAVEQYYLNWAKGGSRSCFNFTILSIYSASAATILYTFALEPRFVRPSYMKFLDNLSNHRLHQLNRMVLDVFGTGSSVGYEDYFPDLDPRFMSNQFKELVFNWMIQPYE